jgi:hypothetical protein
VAGQIDVPEGIVNVILFVGEKDRAGIVLISFSWQHRAQFLCGKLNVKQRKVPSLCV